MNYNLLLDLVTELGYRLAMSGAETFRVEESINRIMDTYGIQAEVFAIPNCLTVSIENADGKSMTRMRRIGQHGNNLDGVEKYNNLSRKICQERPEPDIGMDWLKETEKACKKYPPIIYLLGCVMGAFGFGILFGGSYTDCLCAGLCGLLIGTVNILMEKWRSNQFFQIITAAFLMAMLAYFLKYLGLAQNTDAVIIAALMSLVPGLLFTNALRDIMYGDTNSGMNRIVQVFLIAAAIALGTGAALALASSLWTIPASAPAIRHEIWIEIIASFISCAGFSIIFNVHGTGTPLCALGGVFTWIIYRVSMKLGCGEVAACFFGTLFSSVYAEAMARIRKYPAISYLVMSMFPLIPGAGVYYTMTHAVQNDMASFSSQGMHTLAIAGAMAVAILLVSTVFRMISIHQLKKQK